MYFLISVLTFAAVTLAFVMVERIYRSPAKPRWIDYETVGMLIAVGFTGAFAGSFGIVLATAMQLPLPMWGNVASALVVIAAAALAVRFLVRFITPRPVAH